MQRAGVPLSVSTPGKCRGMQEEESTMPLIQVNLIEEVFSAEQKRRSS